MTAMKKLLMLFALLSMFALPVTALAQTQTFRDVPTSHFAFDAIHWVSDPENGSFMVGDAGNNFHPGRHINKFEAAQIYAMAAGFRHVTHGLPESERAVFARSFETWLPLLNEMADEYSSWSRTVDREIAFLLYREILTPDDVRNFVTRTDTTEQRAFLTRQQAVAWILRLAGESDAVAAFALPPATPFLDDAQISHVYRRYVYHARDLGIITGDGGYMNPVAHLTRAEMAVVFRNALAEKPENTPDTGQTTAVSGTISSVHLDTHVGITSDAGTNVFPVARTAVVMLDNAQRSVAFLREGMAIAALVDEQGNIISLSARSIEERERVIQGIITDFVPPQSPGGIPMLTIENPYGDSFELRILPATQFVRNNAPLLGLNGLRIGDAITAELYTDSVSRAAALGSTSVVRGRLTEIRITERISEITLELEEGIASYFIRPELFDVYTLRVGMHLSVELDSSEVMYVNFV